MLGSDCGVRCLICIGFLPPFDGPFPTNQIQDPPPPLPAQAQSPAEPMATPIGARRSRAWQRSLDTHTTLDPHSPGICKDASTSTRPRLSGDSDLYWGGGGASEAKKSLCT